MGLPCWLSGKDFACSSGDCLPCRRHRFDPWVKQSPGEGNDNTLQYSCLGNPVDRGAWWVTIHGVTRVRQDLGSKPPPVIFFIFMQFIVLFWSSSEISSWPINYLEVCCWIVKYLEISLVSSVTNSWFGSIVVSELMLQDFSSLKADEIYFMVYLVLGSVGIGN